MTMCEPSRGTNCLPTLELFPTSSLGPRHVRTSAAPTPRAKASTAKGRASISTPSVSSESATLVGSLLRTALICEVEALTGFSASWKASATPAGRSWSVLKTWGPITSASAAGSSDAILASLPTPRKSDAHHGPEIAKAEATSSTGVSLITALAMGRRLPTPMKQDGMPDGAGGGAGSTFEFRRILGTPTKGSKVRSSSFAEGRSPTLREALPTPTKRDKRMDAWSPAYERRNSPTMDAVLDAAMTGKVTDDKWAYAREIASLLSGMGLTGASQTLPVTYGWMMGYPPGWLTRALLSAVQGGRLQQASSSKPSATPSSRKSRKPSGAPS